MRYVIGFLHPDRLFAVLDALADLKIQGMTVSDARSFGHEHDAAHPGRQEDPGMEMSRKIRVEIVCRKEEVETVLDAFYRSAHSGRRTDGKVFVLPVVDALRLTTGERGAAALGPGSPGS